MTIRTLSGRTPNSAPTKKGITSIIRTLDFKNESVNVQNYLLNIVHTGIVQRSSQSLKFIEIWQLKSTGVRSKESRQESQQRISYYDLFLVDYLFFFVDYLFLVDYVQYLRNLHFQATVFVMSKSKPLTSKISTILVMCRTLKGVSRPLGSRGRLPRSYRCGCCSRSCLSQIGTALSIGNTSHRTIKWVQGRLSPPP